MKVYMATGLCGKMVGAVADMENHREDTAEQVAGFIKSGFPITRGTAEEVKDAEWCDNRGNCTDCAVAERAVI